MIKYGNRYKKGANFEREVADNFRERGYFAVRSAGSHRPADVVAIRAIHTKNGVIPETTLIQCQTSKNFPPAKRKALVELAQSLGCLSLFAYKEKGKMYLIEHMD